MVQAPELVVVQAPEPVVVQAPEPVVALAQVQALVPKAGRGLLGVPA